MEALAFEGRAAGISFRQLKLFEAVGRANSVRKAADECNLSQPAVTQALAKMEETVGTRLFDRRSSGSYLNASGQILYRRAVRFFRQMEEAIREFDAAGDEIRARIVANRFSRSHIRGLVAIVDYGSCHEAANRLAITDSSLQRIVRIVEKNLGKPVVGSTSTGKAATPEGAAFGRKLKLALQEINWGLEDIDAARGSAPAQIVIGAMPFGGSVLLASVLEEFVSRHPGVDVKIVNENATELLRSLANGSVDFVVGIVQEAAGDEFEVEALAQTPYSVVARRGHPLLRKGDLAIRDLLDYHWVIGTPGSHRRACFDRLFEASQGPRASIATCALPIIHHLLVKSDRLTLMTSYEILHDNDTLVALPFADIDLVPWIGITTRANWLPKRSHGEFLDLLRRHMTQAAGPDQRSRGMRAVISI